MSEQRKQDGGHTSDRVCRVCGSPAFYDEPLCENHWAEYVQRYHGLSQRVPISEEA